MAQQVAGRMTGSWELYATDRFGTRQAVIESFEKAEAVAKMNDITTWTATLPTDTEAGEYLATEPFARVEFVLDALVWRSGPVTKLEREVDIDGDMLTVSGVDDTAWLSRRLAHPQPGSAAPPYNTQDHDTRTGSLTEVLTALANVNAGPGAVTARRVTGLTVATPTPGPPGITVKVEARWQNLLTLLQDTARPYRVLFQVRDLIFEAFEPLDRGVVFSQGFETLAGWKLTREAPTTNYVVVAGGGEGTARLIYEDSNAGSVSQSGRFEGFVDQRQTTDPQQMTKAAQEALAAGVKPTAVVFTPIDTPTQRFGHDWGLGDIVTVVAGGLIVTDQVREVHVTLDGAGATVTPSVGQATADLMVFKTLANTERRLRQLERI